VIGDVMLDEYLSGEVQRICPEAPVPVVELQARSFVPGGAANAAANIAALGGRVFLGGVTGDDLPGCGLRNACLEAGVDASGLISDSQRRTTVKTRVVARGQQILRIDDENRTPASGMTRTALALWAERKIAESEAVLLSDYGKGVVRGLAGLVIAAACRLGRPVVVDPKGNDDSEYKGATVIKPNVGELGELMGRTLCEPADLVTAGKALARRHPMSAVLVTLGAAGMLLFRDGDKPVVIEAAPVLRVFDVTGAGDTTAAALVLALAAGLSLERAARIAAVAAGIVVGKPGTSLVGLGELQERLASLERK